MQTPMTSTDTVRGWTTWVGGMLFLTAMAVPPFVPRKWSIQ